MAYNLKQYAPALNYLPGGDANVVDAWDKKRIQAYDLYENLYINASQTLKIVLRGADQSPILMPSGKKIIEATNRFLGVGFDYLIEAQGDAGTQTLLDQYFKELFARESCAARFASNKRWGLVRGDACFYINANPNKPIGARLSITELDPRQLFEIENSSRERIGLHIVDVIQDFREPDDSSKTLARRRTFRKQLDENGQVILDAPITSELTFWEIGKWDDRNLAKEDLGPVTEKAQVNGAEEVFELPDSITELPVYKWRNSPPQNSTWGSSQLQGLETLLYAINQSLTDEDAVLVFQGLGMYVTSSAPPIDPNTNEVTDWNIGPMQIIEIGQDQTFERVTGVTDVSPLQSHMTFIDEKGLSESSGVPEIAIGRVDVAVAESGISLQLQLMPLLAQNAEKELELITVLDQMFHDITTMWLPAYESEGFGDYDIMQEMSVVCVFDDPAPKNRDAQVQETLLLQTSNLILTSMAVAKLRTLGWDYPTHDDAGNPLTDDDIATMLNAQVSANATAQDPFSAGLDGGGEGTDANGDPIDPNAGNAGDQQTIGLGTS